MMPILYVDDNEARAVVCNHWLREAGFKVLYAANGKDALALLEREHPRALLVDVHLPDIGGIEVCQRAKARARHIPVILFSALFRSPHDQLEGLSECADLYLAEPLRKDTLLSAIGRVLN